jgi:hypothetical protein
MTSNSLGAVEVDLIVGSVSRTTMFMVVPSRADFNVLLGSPIDKQLVTIPPVISLGPKYTIAEDEMYSMKLQPGSGFVWEENLLIMIS